MIRLHLKDAYPGANYKEPDEPFYDFTEEESDDAACIANDIHEDIDNKENRARLRRAVSWWSLRASQYAMNASCHRSDSMMAQLRYNMLRIEMQSVIDGRGWFEKGDADLTPGDSPIDDFLDE